MVTSSNVKIIKMHNAPLHINPELEAVIVKSGCVKVSSGRDSYSVLGGQFTIIPSYRLHGFEICENTESLVYLFPSSMSADFLNLCRNKDVTNKVFTPDKIAYEYILSATETIQNSTNPFLEKSLLYTLLAEFSKDNTFTNMSLDCSNTNRIIEYVFLNIDENLSTKSVASEFAISENQLNDMLSGYVGLSFKEFLTSMRVTNAMELLKTSTLNITEIAYASGFDSTRTFNRAFLRIVGKTPSEYKKASFKKMLHL